MTAHLKRYLDYLRNTGAAPCPTAWFDEDWEPIGPTVRQELVDAGLATVEGEGVTLTDAGRALL